MSSKEPYLGVEDAAKYLCLHIETVRRLAREGVLPAVKIGRAWRFKISVLDQWASSQGAGPVQPSRAGNPANRSENEAIPAPLRILCLDDDEDIHGYMEQVLTAEGYVVDSAMTGEEAEILLKAHTPDLILLDLQLPAMSGADFLSRNRAALGETPIVIITNYPESQLLLEVMRITPVTMLAKPLTRHELIKTIRVVLGSRLR